LQKGRTITGKYYATLLEKLVGKIRNNRENMEEEGIFLLHDNATPHTSKISREAITRLRLIQLSHPLYSPDLALSDY
jgi:histone-lysine N-methyltransferase SETMAR